MKLSAAAAMALGLGLRLWFIGNAASIAGDSLIYGDIAKNLLARGIYGFAQNGSGPIPTLIRLPGYPLFLAACFRVFGVEHYTAVMYVQCGIDLLTCLIVSALAWRLFGRRAALVALWLAALCPFTANYVAAPLTETPSLFCIALTLYVFDRWRDAGPGWNRWLWITSAAMASALLLRPEQCLLAASVIPAMLWLAWRGCGFGREKALAGVPVLVAALCVVLPLAPWAARNWRTFHVFQPLAPRSATDPGEPVPAGFYRWYRTWAIDFVSTDDVYWNYDGAPVEIGDLPTRAFDSDQQYARTDALLNAYNRTLQPKAEYDAEFARIAKERIHADPLRYYVALPVARLADMLFRPRTELLPVSLAWWKWSEHPGESAFSIAYGALNLAYFALGCLGLWRWRRRGWNGHAALAWAMLGFVLLRIALLLTLDNSEPRYTLELFPLLILWASALFAQGPDNGEIKRDSNGRVSFDRARI
jgi:4-amino-4-deoxy-L-arabinose transferase-like glycosyltransferase